MLAKSASQRPGSLLVDEVQADKFDAHVSEPMGNLRDDKLLPSRVSTSPAPTISRAILAPALDHQKAFPPTPGSAPTPRNALNARHRSQLSEVAPFGDLHVLLLAAHPDDEVLGAGGQFNTMKRLSIVHLTDGASSHREAWRRGWLTRGMYANARRVEAILAAGLGRVPFDQFNLGCCDRAATLDLVSATLRLAELLRERAPDLVLTHPYEGGHPDHDAAAFVAHWACRLAGDVPLWEMLSYHAAEVHREGSSAPVNRPFDIAVTTGTFLETSDGGVPAVALRLPAAILADKRRMLACFASQTQQLEELGADLSIERFRPAPAYDFNRAPHEGTLLYETQPWARMTGKRWRLLAAQARAALEES